MVKNVTVLVIGESGAGKSQNGNGFLQKDDAFETDSRPDSCTFITSAKCNQIDGIVRYYIDTQGISSSDGLDSKHLKQMKDFLKDWKLGVNAFFIVINVQCPKFDQGIQLIMKMINDLFNDPKFWNQAGIIFTKCYPGLFDRNMAEQQYQKLVIDFIKTFPGCESLNLEMPCFFVDSPKYNSDQSTISEYDRMIKFAEKNEPLPTNNVQRVRAEYKSKEEITMNRVLVNTSYSGYGISRVKTLTYQDQKKYKITDWNNNITYTNPVAIRTWNENHPSTNKTEYKTETTTEQIPIFRTEYGGRRYGICGPRSSWQVLDHYDTKVTNTEYIRNIIIDPDGNISSSGPWSVNRQW